MIRGPIKIDLCYHEDGDTVAKFDVETGNYMFQTTNRDKYPPGRYVFTITGTSGGMSDSAKFVMNLVDHPCAYAKIDLKEQHFPDVKYVLGDSKVKLPWRAEDLVASPLVNDICGPVKIEFINQDGTPIDELLFRDRRGRNPNFQILQTYSADAIGEYEITYKAFYKKFSWAYTLQEFPFTIKISDGLDVVLF